MAKLSKSELSTPEFEERARVATLELAAKREAYNKMWANGAYVWQAGKRGFIFSRRITSEGTTLRVWWDDGRMTDVMPYALNR